jgi:uncharacterized protein DUF2334
MNAASSEAVAALRQSAPTTLQFLGCQSWLPRGKRAAVCFSVDDVHPSSARDGLDAGGDLDLGSLGNLALLQNRLPQLRVTLFVTPDWRLDQLRPTRPWLARVPILRERMHWAPLRRRGHFRLDRFPAFVDYLNSLPRTEVAVHGLTHAHPGPRMATEFQWQSRRACVAAIREARRLFAVAGLRHVPGFAPPAWNAPAALCEALIESGFHYLASARDLVTDIAGGAQTQMSGLRGAALIHPMWIRPIAPAESPPAHARGDRILHFTTNFQATSSAERALSIVEAGGLLSIKAHVFKSGGGITMLDGLDADYCGYIESICRQLAERYGDSIWWTTFGEVAARCRLALT